jgi:hypothetical protein
MSRAKRFVRSLFSGYIQLAVNSLFTLASVRLALHYLPKDDYALWMPVTVIASYIALIDFGMSGATSRIIIDYKDHHQTHEYGGVIQTAALVGLTQTALISLAGLALAFVMGPLLKIPAALQREFFWLVVAQCFVTGILFGSRIFTLILGAHQRFDIANYSSALALIVNGAVLWWSFAHGGGVYSLVWGQVTGVVAALLINWLYCLKLGLFPKKGAWGRPTWVRFNEIFAFGRDVFLFSVGLQFISLSQTLLLTRFIGLEAALTWGVCTRGFMILQQVIGRLWDFSTAALAEMMVRHERDKLLRRIRDIAVLSINLSVAAGAVFAVANGPFVEAWTKGQIHWLPRNDVLLAVWLVVTMIARVHLGLIGIAKAFRFLRFLIFIEGATFIGLTAAFHGWGGITAMLCLSITCSLCMTIPYGLWRTLKYLGISASEMAAWHRGTLLLALTVAPVGICVWWWTRHLPVWPRLAVDVAGFGAWAALMFVRFGMGSSMYAEMCGHLPGWAKKVLLRATSAQGVVSPL